MFAKVSKHFNGHGFCHRHIAAEVVREATAKAIATALLHVTAREGGNGAARATTVVTIRQGE